MRESLEKICIATLFGTQYKVKYKIYNSVYQDTCCYSFTVAL